VISSIPIIAIDGPAASGKGAVAQAVAEALGFHYLDSGAIYRAAALAIEFAGKDIDGPNLSESDVASIAAQMDLRFSKNKIWLSNHDITESVRSEECGKNASKIAVLPALRATLLDLQHSFRRPPGLVAEGRDMGSVVFPNAVLKIFLIASAEVRAERRHKQLMEKGINATIRDLLREIQLRDARDRERSVAPLRASNDTVTIDTSALDLPQSIAAVLKFYAPLNTAGL
jgi:cytidylate kinase